jgi:hypothetical protein
MYRVTFLESETEKICRALDDPWRSIVVAPGSDDSLIIDDEKEKVRLYLKNIEMLWQLGANTEMKSRFEREANEVTGAALPSPRLTRNIVRRI